MNWLCLDNIFRDSSSKTVAHGQRYDTSLVALLYCSLHCSGCLRAGTRYQVLVYDTSGTNSTPSPAFCHVLLVLLEFMESVSSQYWYIRVAE